MNKLRIIVFTLFALQAQTGIFAMNLFSNKYALHTACKNGDLERVKKLTAKSSIKVKISNTYTYYYKTENIGNEK